METYDNVLTPPISTINTHRLITKSFFIKSTGFAPRGVLSFNNGTRTLPMNEEVIVIEHGIGYNGEWARIDYKGEKGFLLVNSLQPLKDTKAFCEINESFLPNEFAFKGDWKNRKMNEVYYDEYTGKVSVHLELPYETVNGREDLLVKMNEALFSGATLILKESGKFYGENYVNSLLNSFYQFAQAEEYFFPTRECSTLRVLVTIPKRFLENGRITRSLEDTTTNPFFADGSFGDFLDKLGAGIQNPTNDGNPEASLDKQRYKIYTFNNFEEYHKFFSGVASYIGQAHMSYIAGMNGWYLEPNISLDFIQELSSLNAFYSLTNKLLEDNLPRESLKIIEGDFLATLSNFGEQLANTFAAVAGFGSLPIPDNEWKGKLTLVIDRTNLILKHVSFVDESDKKIPINVGVISYLNDEYVLNKTTINYITKFFYDKPKNLGDRTQEATTQFIEDVSNIDTPNTDSLQASIDAKINFEGNRAQDIKATADYGQKVAKEGLTIVNQAVDGFEQALAVFTPETFLQTFLKDRHYPVITTVRMNPINLQDCVVDNYDRVTKLLLQKAPEEKQKAIKIWDKAAELRKARKEEGSIWDRATKDFKGIKDPNLRAIFGMDPPLPPDPNDGPIEKFKKTIRLPLAAVNLIDWSRILAEAIKCSAVELDPQLMQELLKTYQKGRKIVEIAALATVCNPYLTALLKKLLSFDLPLLPNVDPTKSLSDAIARQILKLINDALVLLLRQWLTGSLRACLGNPKNSSDLTNPEGIKNSLDIGAGNNDPNINDMLNDLFAGGGGIYDENGNIDPERKAEALDRIKNLIDDIIPCLTPLELCNLLLGNTVDQEIYDVILSLIKRKYSTPDNSIDIASRLNNTDAIKIFFKKLGDNMGIDLAICTPILENAPQSNNLLQFCDGNYVEQLRRDILLKKGLTNDLIDDLLDKARDQKNKDIEDILKALESDRPFDFKVPSALCTTGPNGETIPPDINLSPALNDFSNLVDNMLEEIYTTFDAEATEWYKTTFTSVSSINNNLLYFDRETNQIKTVELSTDNLGNVFGDQFSNGDTQNGNVPTAGISASYIFNDIINNNKIKTNFDFSKYNLSSFINGYEQQKLDQNIINDELRNNIGVAENSLKIFLGQFMLKFTEFFAYTIFDLIVNQPIVSNLGPNLAWYERVAGVLGNITSSELIKLISTFDLFARNNIADAKELEKSKEILGLNTAADANAFLAADIGASSYLSVMNYMIENQTALLAVIDKIHSIDITNNVQVYLLGPNSNRPNVSNVEEKRNLLLKYNKALENFNLVKDYYSTVLNAKISYPDFNIDFNLGNSELKINDYITFPNNFNDNFYELYDINISKNQTNYIKIRNGQKIDNNIKEYISKDLNINLKSTNKLAILDAFIKNKKSIFPNTLTITEENEIYDNNCYSVCNKTIINSIRKNIIDNPMLIAYQSSEPPPTPPADASDEEQKETLKALQNSKDVYTRKVQLLTTISKQNQACGKRPHYLDIDEIKNDMIENKKNSFCLDLIKEERILNDEPIPSADLENLELGDTQAILQNGNYSILLRLCLHDVLLRGIGVFGRYDPQSLRNSEIFVQFMADLVESEIRGLDTTVFSMMINHFYNQYLFKNPNVSVPANRVSLVKRDIYIDFIRNELKTNVLAKLAKRLNEDTNTNLASLQNTLGKEVPRLKIKNILNDYHNIKGILNITNDSVYLKINASSNTSEYLKIYSSSGSSVEATINEFKDSNEFNLLFKYIFPLEHILTFIFITNVLATSTRRQIVSGFRDTKKALFRIIKNVQTNGQDITPDNSNMQDVLGTDEIDSWGKFIQKMIIESTLEVVKGFVETTDFNIAISSSAYKLLKSLASVTFDPTRKPPKISSALIPAISIPLGIPIPPPFPLGILPYTNIPLAAVYFGLGLWYEDDKEDKETNDKMFVEEGLNNDNALTCETATSTEAIIKNNEGYYTGTL